MCRFSVARPGGGVICPSLAAKKRRAVLLFQRLSTPGHQPALRRSGWLLLKRGTMKKLTMATASAMLIGSCFASSTSIAATEPTQNGCGDDARLAIARARQALQKDDRDDDRTALACLVEAVAALDARISGLADGSMPFEGQIYAPKGVVMIKPSDQGGR